MEIAGAQLHQPWAEGWDAGLRQVDIRECPYKPGTAEYQFWQQFYSRAVDLVRRIREIKGE